MNVKPQRIHNDRAKQMAIKKGSFTVEASLIIPLVLMAVIGVLLLFFYVHTRSYLTAAAAEAALLGAMEENRLTGSGESKAGERAGMRLRDGFFTGSLPEVSVTCGEEIAVAYHVTIGEGFRYASWELEAKAAFPLIVPAIYVWRNS